MTLQEFNEKWRQYRPEFSVGLEIDHPDVIRYLDEQFAIEVLANHKFIYRQIKVKFESTRVYSQTSKNSKWEKDVDQIMGLQSSAYSNS